MKVPTGKCARCGGDREDHPCWCPHCRPIAARLQVRGWSMERIAAMGELDSDPESVLGWRRRTWPMGKLDGIMLAMDRRIATQAANNERKWRARQAARHADIQRQVAAQREEQVA